VLKLSRSQWSLLALLPIASLFFIGGPSSTTLPWLRYAWNLGHIGFFFIASLAVIATYPRFSKKTPWLYLGAITLISLFIEWLQSSIGRDASILDMARNVTGATMALSVVLKRKVPIPAFSCAVGFLVFDLFGFSEVAYSDWQHQQRLPLIENFETDQYLSRWHTNIQRTNDNVFSGSFSGFVPLKASKYSGIQISPVPRNWSAYQSLTIALFNSQSSARDITLRIHDVQHEKAAQYFSDRFNRTFTLQPGWNQLEIDLEDVASAPKNRRLDLTQMHQIGMFYSGLEQNDYLLIDKVQLEP
jgi:VanZ family protein